MVVLVTGANGQLGQSLQHIADRWRPGLQFVFCNSQQLDITDPQSIKAAFERYKPDYCINAAAYTAVDKAESEPERAFAINVTAVKQLAEVCKAQHTVLLHVSTDFVFDGTKTTPYTEQDTPNPQSVYGHTKREGELAIQAVLDRYYIIRTSWVYSQFGNNFLKTMLRLGSERDSLQVVSDQIGTPTNAVDLAEALCTMVTRLAAATATGAAPAAPGIYNYSNEGQCSWYEFAKKIFEIHKIKIDLHPIPTSSYPTPAKRPKYSVLDKTMLKDVFGLKISDWQESLKFYTDKNDTL